MTGPLLCPPGLDLVTRVSRPCICLCWGGIGASAPCLAAVPVVCETTRLQLGSTTAQAVAATNNNKLVLYFNPTYTRTGWIGQPPVLDRHEVVTIDGEVVTLRQATP